MPSLRTVERQISKIEDLDVIIRHQNGRDVRSDLNGLPGYSYERSAKGSMTVAEWKAKRFSQSYPGYGCDVVDGDGHAVAGNTQLATVRDSYRK